MPVKDVVDTLCQRGMLGKLCAIVGCWGHFVPVRDVLRRFVPVRDVADALCQ